MADSLLQPDSSGRTPGGTTAAENITDKPTAGAGGEDGSPVTNDATPGNPTVTDPGVTGGTPTGGGKAVPDDAVLENGGMAGDDTSLDDSSGLENGDYVGNQGAQPPTPGGVRQGAGPTITESGSGQSDDGGAPTEGLAGTNTSGGTAFTETGVGLGSENH